MPIVITKEEWARITRWTDSGREDPETVRRREYLQYLNQTSKEMTKNWPNSLETVNKRSEELRRARAEAAEKANTKFHQRYVRKQREQQQRLMYSAGDTVFKNKDAPKLLLSAVIETAIQKERQEQIKFKQRLQQEAAEEKRRDDDDIIRKAKEWNELMEIKRKRRFDVNKQHQKEILDQAIEVSERNRKEYEMESKLQKIDNIQAAEQKDAIKEFEKKFRADEKARILSDMQRSREEAASRRLETDTRSRVDDQLIDVLQRTQARIERRRKRTEKQIQEEKQLVLEKISHKLESGDAAREEKERMILEKAVREKEAIAEARRQEDAAKQAKFRAERAEVQAQFLQRQEQSLHDYHTMRQWEIMNRFKNAEIYQDFQEQLRDEKERKIKQYREDIIKLWHERADREARERADTRYYYGELAESKLRASDNKLLMHGAALLDEARRMERPTYALKRALERYCKLYRLYPMPELPDSMQEHYPRYTPADLSRPDDDYRYPQPPVFDDNGKDGRQQPKAAVAPVLPDPDDYRRAAPANGLQRNPGKIDVRLPAVSPSVEPQCRCECKK